MSRKNQGWPGHDSPHTAQEIIVFSHFDSADELATALDSEDKFRLDLAVLSMKNIRHVGKCLKWYLQGVKFLRNNKGRIDHSEPCPVSSGTDAFLRSLAG